MAEALDPTCCRLQGKAGRKKISEGAQNGTWEQLRTSSER